jgi:hypothetical protein
MAKTYTLIIAADSMSFYCSCSTKISIAMNLLNVLILNSSLFFMGYGIAYFKSPQMKSEFKRFGLAKAGTLTAVLELLGAVGLLAGLKFHLILMISAGGLAILMFLGVAIRIKAKDGFWRTLPALLFMILNAFIFFISLPYTK